MAMSLHGLNGLDLDIIQTTAGFYQQMHLFVQKCGIVCIHIVTDTEN